MRSAAGSNHLFGASLDVAWLWVGVQAQGGAASNTLLGKGITFVTIADTTTEVGRRSRSRWIVRGHPLAQL